MLQSYEDFVVFVYLKRVACVIPKNIIRESTLNVYVTEKQGAAKEKDSYSMFLLKTYHVLL